MPKTKISEFDLTPANNTDIDGIDIAEGCAPSGINNAIRELMSQLKDFQGGTSGDTLAVAAGGTGGATTTAALQNLGGTTTGINLFKAISSTVARTELGATTVGNNVFTAASTTAALQSLGATTTGINVFVATDAAAARTAIGAGTGNGDVTTSASQTFTAAQTFRAANAIRSEAAATQDAVVIAGRAGGSNSYAVTLTPATLAGNRTITIPEAAENVTLGFLNIPQNSKSAAYTLVLEDSGKHILHPSADTTARTFTIPANSSVAFPIGTAITFINQNGAGTVTIAITSDTMRLAGAGTTGSRTLAANGVATAIKITSTEWIISGNGLT